MEMSNLMKVILVGSLLLNLIAIWGLFHYIMYGGNPLLEIKRKLTGTTRVTPPSHRWAEENSQIRKDIASGVTDSLRVVFYGASITQNWDLPKYFTGIHPLNRGVGGFVPELLAKYKANVLDLKPRAVVFKLCSINIRPTIPQTQLRDGIEMMTQLARVNDIAPILATMVPSAKSAGIIGEFSVVDAIKEFNDWLREYAAANQLALIDYAAAIQDENGYLPRDCSIDPVHVNDKGYDLMAEAARPVLYQVLGVQ